MSLGGGLMSSMQGTPQLYPEVERMFHMLSQMGRGDLKYSRGIPGSSPQEQAAMASSSGLLGQQIGGQQQQMLAALGGPQSGNFQNAGDAMSRFNSNATGQYGSLLQMLMNHFMQMRRDARGQAASEFGQAGQLGGAPRMPQTDIGGALGNAAYAWGMQRAMGGNPSAGGSGMPTPGGGMTGGSIAGGSPGGGPITGGHIFPAMPNTGGVGATGVSMHPMSQGMGGGSFQPDEFQRRLLGQSRTLNGGF